MAEETQNFEVRTAGDVTPEILEIVRGIVEGWYNEGRIDWEDVWDRVEKSQLDTGQGIDMGTDLLSPAIKEIQKKIRTWGRCTVFETDCVFKTDYKIPAQVIMLCNEKGVHGMTWDVFHKLDNAGELFPYGFGRIVCQKHADEIERHLGN